MNQKPIDRRKHPRFLANNEYTLILDGKQYLGTIGDISLGGVLLKTTAPELHKSCLHQECDILVNLDDTNIFIPCTITLVTKENGDHLDRAGIEFTVPLKDKTMAVVVEYIKNIEAPVE